MPQPPKSGLWGDKEAAAAAQTSHQPRFPQDKAISKVMPQRGYTPQVASLSDPGRPGSVVFPRSFDRWGREQHLCEAFGKVTTTVGDAFARISPNPLAPPTGFGWPTLSFVTPPPCASSRCRAGSNMTRAHIVPHTHRKP